jgi:hypothetical protein
VDIDGMEREERERTVLEEGIGVINVYFCPEEMGRQESGIDEETLLFHLSSSHFFFFS